MRLFATFTGSEWSDLAPSEDDETPGHEEEFREQLKQLLRTENLVVLTGLGTSLCINDQSGSRAAPTMARLWEAIKEEVGSEDLQAVCKDVRQPSKRSAKAERAFKKDIELLLSRCLLSEQFESSPEVRKFINVAEATIANECDFVDDETLLPVHESFLRKIARRSTQHPRAKIFTTNYDLAFETAANRIDFIAIDGFSHALPQRFDSSYFAYDLVRREDDSPSPHYIPNVFHLYKLHGSIDWEVDGDTILKRKDTSDPLLIYPRHSKYELSYESPFLDMMARFQSTIRKGDTALLIVGFGFNDKHLTQPILSAIRSNVGLKVMVVSPSLEEDDNTAVEEFRGLIEAGDSRLCLVAEYFENFVPLLPDLVSETEEELHWRRIRRGDAK